MSLDYDKSRSLVTVNDYKVFVLTVLPDDTDSVQVWGGEDND